MKNMMMFLTALTIFSGAGFAEIMAAQPASDQVKTAYEKVCVVGSDVNGTIKQMCEYCRCVTGNPVQAKTPGALYECDDKSTPVCVKELPADEMESPAELEDYNKLKAPQ